MKHKRSIIIYHSWVTLDLNFDVHGEIRKYIVGLPLREGVRTGYAPGVATLCQGQTLSARDPATELLWNLDLPFFFPALPC